MSRWPRDLRWETTPVEVLDLRWLRLVSSLHAPGQTVGTSHFRLARR